MTTASTLHACFNIDVGDILCIRYIGIECNDTENAGVDNEYNCTLYQHSCPEDSFHTDICGRVELSSSYSMA